MNESKTVYREISYAAYLNLPAERRGALADYYARQLQRGGGKLCALCRENEVLSFLILDTSNPITDIAYLETDLPYRGRGLATSLLEEAMKDPDRVYRLHFTSQLEHYEALLRIAHKIGFVAGMGSTVFTGETGEAMWKRMDALPLAGMQQLLLRDGRVCVPFAACTQAQLQAIQGSGSSEFDNTLLPEAFVDNPAKSMDRALSFALFEGEKLLAYSLVTRPSASHVIVEQIADASCLRGTGAIVAPLYQTLQAIRRDGSIRKMSMTIANDNAASCNFVHSMLKGVELKETKNVCLYYRLGLKA